MGVSIEVWRARIGLFAGVMRSKSCLQRVWPHGKRRRTYQVPPKPPRKHHVPILICFLALAVLSAIDGQDPGQTFRHSGRGCVVVISAAAWFTGTCFLKIQKWRNRLTLGLLILLVSLLLTCGDVESNPGPKGAKPKMTYKVRLEETGKKFGTSASSMADMWCRISQKWDITSDDYILCEDDDTEIEDDDYLQGLPNGSLVNVRSILADQNDDHQHSRRKKYQPLTDEMIHDIAVSHLSLDDVRPLGFTMGFNHTEIQKYERENTSDDNLVRSRGTEHMIHHWIKGHSQRNYVAVFCRVLRKAGLHDLADKIENGASLSVQRPTISSDVLNVEKLQTELRQHYCHKLCYMKMIPWREDSACSVEDYFIPLSLIRQKRVPRGINADTAQFDSSKTIDKDNTMADSLTYFTNMVRGLNHLNSGITVTKGAKPPSLSRLHDLLQFPDYQFKDDYLRNSLVFEPLPHSDNIFQILENGELCHRILVSGKPGIGKSTLSCKLAYDWVNQAEQSPLRNVPLLFVLSLSSVDVGSSIGDEVVKQLLPDDTAVTASQINNYIQTHQEDVAVIYDGLDENALLNQSLSKTDSAGNIMKSIKYEALRSCRILVTTRPWLEDELLRNLFTVYAQIQIYGFSMKSINEFVDKYCQGNQILAKRVKDKISVDLRNLSHLFHVPLFLVMLCEMVRAEMDISACDTLTSFIEKVCLYLFSSYNSKPTCKSLFQRPLDENEMRECLRALGAIATQGITASDNVHLDKGLATGLLSRKSVFGDQKIEGLQIPEKSTVFYFCHGLLNDFCISHYLSSLPEANIISYIEKLLDGFGIFTFRYVMLFLCGLNQKVVPMIFKHLREANLQNDIYTEFAVQCYFEGKIVDEDVNANMFSFTERLVIDICHLNSFQAAKYLLSNNRNSSISFNQLHILRGNIADSYNGDTDTFMTPFVLHPHHLNDIYLWCSNLTIVDLHNLMFDGVTSQEETELSGSCCKSITSIRVFLCRDDTLLTNLLKTMMLHLPKLEHVEMVNISVANSDRKCSQIGIEFVLNIFTNINCPLGLVQINCIQKSIHSSDLDSSYLLVVKSGFSNKCGCVISLHPYVASCEFQTMTSGHHKTSLVLSHCTQPQAVHSECRCCSLSHLTVDNCKINFKPVKSPPTLKSYGLLQRLVLSNLTQPVNLVRLIYNLYQHYPALGGVLIQDTDITNEDMTDIKMTVAKPNPYLKSVHLLRCKTPIQLARTFQPLGYLIPTSLKFVVEECDICLQDVSNSREFEDRISHFSNHSLKLLQCVKPVYLLRTLHFLCHYCPFFVLFHIDQSEITLQGEFNEMTSDHHEMSLVLSHCTQPLPVAQIVDSVCRCCSLSSLMVEFCEINFEPVISSPAQKSNHLLQLLILDNLTQPVKLVQVINNLYRHCPLLVQVVFQYTNITNEDITDVNTTVAKPNRCFKAVHLLRCKKPIHLARTFQPLGYLIPTSLEFLLEECDINLQGISTKFKETDSLLSNHMLSLSRCKEPVNLPLILGVLCQYCPSMTGLRILQSEIILDPVFIYFEYISHHSLKEMHLSDCKLPFNILGIIDLMCYCCSSLVCLQILHSEISLKDVRPALAKRLHQSLKEIAISQVDPTRVGYACKLLRHYCPSLERVTIN